MFKKFVWIGVMVSCALPAAAGAKMVASEVETLLQNSDGNVSLDFRLPAPGHNNFYTSTVEQDKTRIVEMLMREQLEEKKSCAFEFLKQARAAAVKLPPEYANVPVKLTARLDWWEGGSHDLVQDFILDLEVGTGASKISVRLKEIARMMGGSCANLVPADIVSTTLARGTEVRRYLDDQAGAATPASAAASSGRANGGF
jgi:hypothetical protein